MDSRSQSARVHLISGCLCIIAGIALNEWWLASIFSSDGEIAASRRVFIWAFDLTLVLFGSFFVLYRKTLALHHFFLCSGFLLLGLGTILNQRTVALLLSLELSLVDKILVGFVEALFIAGGLLTLFRHKTICLKNFLLALGTVCLCGVLFLAAEYALVHGVFLLKRKAASQFGQSLYISDQTLSFRPRPGAQVQLPGEGGVPINYSIDDRGFRKIAGNPDTPRQRIYFFGDSFTFGSGVHNEEVYAQVLKNDYLPPDVAVFNGGVNGFGITQMVQQFLNLSSEMRPGDVVFFTPIVDDIHRNLFEWYYPYKLFFGSHIAMGPYPFYTDAGMQYHVMEKNLFTRIKTAAFCAPVTGNFWRALNRKRAPDSKQNALLLLDMARTKAASLDLHFALVFLPHPAECLERKYYGDLQGFRFFDIMSYCPGGREEIDRLSQQDGHWNAAGNKVVAKAIFDILVEEGLLADY